MEDTIKTAWQKYRIYPFNHNVVTAQKFSTCHSPSTRSQIPISTAIWVIYRGINKIIEILVNNSSYSDQDKDDSDEESSDEDIKFTITMDSTNTR